MVEKQSGVHLDKVVPTKVTIETTFFVLLRLRWLRTIATMFYWLKCSSEESVIIVSAY